MYNATYFTYDGVRSSIYGLMIADFDNQSIVETPVFNAALNASRLGKSHRYIFESVTHDDMPEHEFSILSEYPILEHTRKEILRWLAGRKGFRRLIVHKPDLTDYYYNCVFTNISIIYINSMCHGFRLTARFDSPYARKNPTTVSLTGNGTAQTVTLSNISDIVDDYVYPTVTFTAASAVSGKNIKIINKTDDNTRAFEFTGLLSNETVTVDNETKIITSTYSAERISNFNKNWLRLRRGDNNLEIVINGSVTITCPAYIMIGF